MAKRKSKRTEELENLNKVSKLEDSRVVGDNLRERACNVLEAGLWADCKFLVGEDRDEIKACRNLLAIASPVFEAMLYGDLASRGAVEVPDIEPQVFKQLLKFIYCREVALDSIEESFAVFTAADKYMMPDLCDHCVGHIQRILTSNKSCKMWCDALNFACFYKNEDLKQFLLQGICNDGRNLEISSSDLLKLDAASLIAVLQQDYLDVGSEVKVIEAAVRWATARCEEKDVPTDVHHLRDVLVNCGVLKHIRFLALTWKELEDGPLKSGILTPEERSAVLHYKCTSDGTNLPESLCPISRHRLKYKGDETCTIIGEKRGVLKVTEDEEWTFSFQTKHYEIQLLGLTLESQVHDGHTKLTYDEDIKVFVTAGNQSYALGQFKGKARYSSYIHVPLNLDTKAQLICDNCQFDITVTFYKSGNYPLYGNCTTTDKNLCLFDKGYQGGVESVYMELSYR